MTPTRTDAAARARSATMRQVVLRKGAHEPALAQAPRPPRAQSEVRARTLLVGLDGTDNEVLEGDHGAFPSGEDALVLGHECLAEILEAPTKSALVPGDRVVPLVRHGCGRCAPCAQKRADMCATGGYREHGIRGLHGFLREEWVDDPATLVKVPAELGDLAVLIEPLSIVVKALDEVARIQQRVPGREGLRDARVLLAGTGSLGTLAGFALAHEGANVHALDRSSDATAAAKLLAKLGATHVDGRETGIAELAKDVGGFDLVLEATGSPRVAFDGALALRENGIVCLLGVPREKPAIALEADDVMRTLVLKNACLVGSVNSSADHFRQAATLLGAFRARWGALLDEVITHRYAPDEAIEAFRADDDTLVKKVIDWR